MQGFLFEIDEADIVVHEADNPNAVIDLLDADLRAASSSGSSPIFRKLRSSEIAEIATIEEINFSFRAVKSTVPIQTGRSFRSPTSSLETKFS